MHKLTKRIALSLLALAVAGLAFAAGAPAHTLSTERAEEKLQGLVNGRVKRSDGEYVKGTASDCKRKFPHLVRCKAGYHTKRSLKTKRFACTETWDVKYRAHSEAGESRSVFFVNVGHVC